MNILDLISIFQDTDLFIKIIMLIGLILYNFYALAITFQIFTYNRLMTMATFAPFFRLVAIIHVALSFILLLAVVFSL